MWNKSAEFCANYMKKGSKVFVSGKQKTRKWQDSNGNDRYTTEIIAKDVTALDSRSDSGGSGHAEAPHHNNGETVDDVPF